MQNIERRTVTLPAIAAHEPNGRQASIHVSQVQYRVQYVDESWSEWEPERRTLSCGGTRVTLLPDGRYQMVDAAQTVLTPPGWKPPAEETPPASA